MRFILGVIFGLAIGFAVASALSEQGVSMDRMVGRLLGGSDQA
jgi:hypothetical protein